MSRITNTDILERYIDLIPILVQVQGHGTYIGSIIYST